MPSLRPTTQLPRRAPQSLSLGSLGHSPRLPLMKASESHSRVTRLNRSRAFGVSPSASPARRSFSRQSVCTRLTLPRFSPCLHAMRFALASVWSQVTRSSLPSSAVIGRRFAELSTEAEWPNHALQRTAPCVTAPASAAAFPPTVQVPRRTPLSLSLGSLGDSTHSR